MACDCVCSIQAHHLAKDQRMLQHVVSKIILDRLQHCRSTGMGRQSNNHYSWSDIQSRDLVVVFFQFGYQYHAGMGQREKVIAHTGWIQYHVDMA